MARGFLGKSNRKINSGKRMMIDIAKEKSDKYNEREYVLI